VKYFQDKPIYLLDDPLAAVDAHVAQHLFDHCIMGILEGTTRVLATHHTRFLQKADLVVVMENGKIVKCAPPSQLLFELHIQESSNSAKHNSNPETEPSKLKHDTNEGIANTEEGAAGTLVQAEEKDSGVVKSQVYLSYWKAIGHCLGFSVLLSLLLMQASRNVSDWWLSYWVTHAHQHSSSGNQLHELHKLNFLLASLSNELYRTSVIMTTSMYSNLIPSTSVVNNVSMTNISDSNVNISFYMIV
jgi:ATP-binding cassette subfamily C (CFTR/MRP) protein 10